MNKWFIQNEDWNDRLVCHVTVEREDGRDYVTFAGTAEHIDRGACAPFPPSLSLTWDEGQQIMNELWRAGVRPKNGAGAIAHVETLKAHLDDLRTVAFHALKIPHE